MEGYHLEETQTAVYVRLRDKGDHTDLGSHQEGLGIQEEHLTDKLLEALKEFVVV